MHNNRYIQSELQENKTDLKLRQQDSQKLYARSAINLTQTAQLLESAIQFTEKSQHFQQDSELLQVQHLSQEDYKFHRIVLEDNVTLSPNGSIVVGKSLNGLQLSPQCKILQYEQKAFKLPCNSKEYQQYYIYQGQMDPYGECSQGRGKFAQCKQGSEVALFEGTFNKGYAVDQCRIIKKDNEQIIAQFQEGIVHGIMETLRNGQTISKNTYKNGKLVNNHSCVFGMSKIVYITKETYINSRIFQTLNYGQWLNQKILDIYITLVHNDIVLMKGTKDLEFQDILITPSQFQDIFSSQITTRVEANLNLWASIIEKQKINKITEQNRRYIFMLNNQRCHFLVIVKEGDTLYELNSLAGYSQRSIILSLFANCLKQIPEMNQQYRTKQIAVPQQTNDYDCGIYCIANTIKILQNTRKSVEYINFKNMQTKLLRKHIRNVILDNYHNYIL